MLIILILTKNRLLNNFTSLSWLFYRFFFFDVASKQKPAEIYEHLFSWSLEFGEAKSATL